MDTQNHSPRIRICADAATVARTGATLVADAIIAAVASTETCTIALSGGSTPRALHTLLAQAPLRETIPWDRVHLFWGDERAVPPDHPDSNYRMARETLLNHVPLPAHQIHRWPTEDEPEIAAAAYAQTLRQHFGPNRPTFDVILLGMGSDGHTASLFPGTVAVNLTGDTAPDTAANWVPHLGVWRLTLTFPVLSHAHQVIFLVAGPDKRTAWQSVATQMNIPITRDTLPAARLRLAHGAVTWLIDRAASGHIEE